MNEVFTDSFRQAIKDFSYLIENEYPRKAILKLIGDRFLLSKTQRTLLNRGIIKKKDSVTRFKKLDSEIEDSLLYIDAYNVLFIISNYLMGRLVFISTDGFIRDAGEAYGKLHREKIFRKSIDLIMDYLEKTVPSEIIFYLDNPVAYSGDLAEQLRKSLRTRKLNGNAFAVINPDKELIRKEEGIIATSDSEILNATRCRICDLPSMVLQSKYQLQLTDLREILSDQVPGTGRHPV
jgi:hypothetical protein